jgi:hypothetical protein
MVLSDYSFLGTLLPVPGTVPPVAADSSTVRLFCTSRTPPTAPTMRPAFSRWSLDSTEPWREMLPLRFSTSILRASRLDSDSSADRTICVRDASESGLPASAAFSACRVSSILAFGCPTAGSSRLQA